MRLSERSDGWGPGEGPPQAVQAAEGRLSCTRPTAECAYDWMLPPLCVYNLFTWDGRLHGVRPSGDPQASELGRSAAAPWSAGPSPSDGRGRGTSEGSA